MTRSFAAVIALVVMSTTPASAVPQRAAAGSGVEVTHASSTRAMVCGGADLWKVRQGHGIRVRLKLGRDVAVLEARAGHNGDVNAPTRVRHARVIVHIVGFGSETYRVHPVHKSFGPGVQLAQAISSHAHGPSFCLTHLVGSPHPVAALTTTSGYNQCCLDLSVFSGAGTGRSVLHAGTAPASLGRGQGSVVVRTANPAFTAAFTDYADSNLPLQIYTVQADQLVDSSPSFPHAVRQDAHWQWHQFVHPRNGPHRGLGALAAWVADKYVLGHGASAWSRVQRLARARRLRGIDGWAQGRKYVAQLRAFLIRTGYAS